MTCFECGCDGFQPATVHIAGTRHGESFTVELQGFKCGECGFETVDSIQSVEFTQLVSDAYRRVHGLLTSAEIRTRRARLGFSQQGFADYLGIGSASVKRWEVGQIQDRAMDALIRLKTDPQAARENLQTLERQIPEPFVIFMGHDLSLTMAVGETKYVERLPMVVEDLSIPDGDRVGEEACLAA